VSEHQVTLLGRVDCHACEVAKADLERICGEIGIELTVVDVDTDTELRAEYGDMVPVILINGEEHGYWKVEEERFRAALRSWG